MSQGKNPYARADVHSRAARAQGYPARSVFKLQEMDRRLKLLRPGQRVLDLGAAPGSWSLYALERVGKTGHVLAVDLQPLGVAAPGVGFVLGDALSLENASLAQFAPYDVVLSDMAPNTSGNKGRDQALSAELFLRALSVAVALLKPKGHFVGKLFMSADFSQAKAQVVAAFHECRVIRPESTRQQSSEVFVVGLGRKALEQEL